MSDGERISLILISEIVSAPTNTLFVIDEPELHLHPSIVVPLIAALIRARPDCEFIIGTHELELPSVVPGSQACIVRSPRWDAQGNPNAWGVDIIANAAELPEDLRTDILGSRRRVLFTEGTDASLDVPMYAILFPKASVSPKGGCREVERAVSGVSATKTLHHTEGFSLIDHDGRSASDIAALKQKGIYALDVHSVEALYYLPEVVLAVAQRQAGTLVANEGERQAAVDGYVLEAKMNILSGATATGVAKQLAARLSEMQLRDTLVSQIPDRASLIAGDGCPIQISIPSPYPTELTRLQSIIQQGGAFEIVARYPVRHSSILDGIAKALKFQGRADYEAAALAQVSLDERLRKKLLDRLEPLSAALNA